MDLADPEDFARAGPVEAFTRGLLVLEEGLEGVEEAAAAALRWAAFPLVRRERGERWMRKL